MIELSLICHVANGDQLIINLPLELNCERLGKCKTKQLWVFSDTYMLRLIDNNGHYSMPCFSS